METGVLSEHEAAKNPATKDYEATPQEKAAIKLVRTLWQKARIHRQKYDHNWLDWYKFFRGKQWKEKRPSYRHSEVVNFTFQAIQAHVPILTDSRPRFDYLPTEPSDIEAAKILSQVAQGDWESGNWLYKLTEDIYESHFYGTALGGMEFDPDAMDGLGKVCFERRDVFYAFPDPESFDVNKRCRYLVYAEPRDLEALKAKYPEKADFMRSDLLDFLQGDKTEIGDDVRYRSPIDDKTLVDAHAGALDTEFDKALEITCYVYPNDIDEEQLQKDVPGQTDPDTAKQSQDIKLKYPKGRKIVIAGGVVVFDGENPYDDGLIPMAKLVNYILPGEFWGGSEIEQIESPQRTFNKIISFALDVLTLMGNPIWVVDRAADVDTDNLFNAPGLVVEKNTDGEVRRETGVPLQPYVLQMAEMFRNWINETHGINDVSQGIKPEAVTAASAITALQEAANTRIRQKSRNLDAYLQNLGELYKNRVFQFYTAPRIVRLTKNGEAEKYFRFQVQHVDGADGGYSKKFQVREYLKQNDGSLAESLEAKEYVLRGDFDVRVTTGSSLPFAKAEKANLAFKLFEAQAIDEEELLKAVDYPNWEAVLARIQEKKAQMAMAEAQMEAQGQVTSGQPAPAA